VAMVYHSIISRVHNSDSFPGDFRTMFISTNGIKEIIETLDDSDKDVRESALDFVKELCGNGITFSSLESPNSHRFPDGFRRNYISEDIIKKLIQRFDDWDKDVRKTALDCIKALSHDGITFFSLASSNLIISQIPLETDSYRGTVSSN